MNSELFNTRVSSDTSYVAVINFYTVSRFDTIPLSENDELVSPKEENSKKSLLDKIPLFRKKKTVSYVLILAIFRSFTALFIFRGILVFVVSRFSSKTVANLTTDHESLLCYTYCIVQLCMGTFNSLRIRLC